MRAGGAAHAAGFSPTAAAGAAAGFCSWYAECCAAAAGRRGCCWQRCCPAGKGVYLPSRQVLAISIDMQRCVPEAGGSAHRACRPSLCRTTEHRCTIDAIRLLGCAQALALQHVTPVLSTALATAMAPPAQLLQTPQAAAAGKAQHGTPAADTLQAEADSSRKRQLNDSPAPAEPTGQRHCAVWQTLQRCCTQHSMLPVLMQS